MTKWRKCLRSAVATAVIASMTLTPSLAVIKEVYVDGAWSINDLGHSDYRISMEDLKKDFRWFLDTNKMSEFFHKDQQEVNKMGAGEALSWLIDNNIVTRDRKLTVKNLTGVPEVYIDKVTPEMLLSSVVTKSDAWMYGYKAAFGALPGRTLGIETNSVRVDDGSYALLSAMMDKYLFFIKDEVTGEVIGSLGEKGQYGRPGIELGYIAIAGNGGAGGSGDSGSLENIENRYSIVRSEWRYTPQGDEYTSMFGDTNVFISENHFEQNNSGGYGGNGGNGGDAEADSGWSSAWAEGGAGGDGGDGGTSQNIINYETDYKQIYLYPGADVLFYQPPDVFEMYMQSLLSKGIFNDFEQLTREAIDYFRGLSETTKKAEWSGNSYPYIVNRKNIKLFATDSIKSPVQYKASGVNYTTSFANNQFVLERVNHFNSNTGYFKSEVLTKLQAYRILYDIVYASEKKLSKLESDIVNYKYGMEFEGVANSNDTEVLKYLIAKGIIDYEDRTEFTDLYSSITWQEFVELLYRIANTDARLDFSEIQLTDSEQSWKAKGFYPQTVRLAEGGSVGHITLKMNPDYEAQMSPDETSFKNSTGVGYRNSSGFRRLSLGSNWEMPLTVQSLQTVANGASNAGTCEYDLSKAGTLKYHDYYFDFNGAVWLAGAPEDRLNYISSLLDAIDSKGLAAMNEELSDGYNESNPKHKLCVEIFCNIYAVSAMQVDATLRNGIVDLLKNWFNNPPEWADQKTIDMRNILYGVFVRRCDSSISIGSSGNYGEINVSNIKFVRKDGTSVNSLLQTTPTDLAQNLDRITFDLGDSQVKVFYSGILPESITGDTLSAKNAMNNASAKVSVDFTVAELLAAGGNADELLMAFQGNIGTSALKGLKNDEGFVQYTSASGKDAFVSWDSIAKCIASGVEGLDIRRVSDTILHNKQTDTYAYFNMASEDSKDIALVGNMVITGDSSMGVAFQSGEGEDLQMYYHVDAIKALVNASQENAILSGNKVIALPTKTSIEKVKTYPLYNSDGITQSSLTAVNACISEDINRDSGAISGTVLGQQFNNTGTTAWGTYISVSQANRASNVVCRRITYIPADNSSGNPITGVASAYAVLMLNIDDSIPSPTLNVNSSLEDLLDMPAKSPSTEEGRRVWERNKTACNNCANWIYGTQGETYIDTGYYKPTVRVYVVGELKSALPPAGFFDGLSSEDIRDYFSIQELLVAEYGAFASLDETLSFQTLATPGHSNKYRLSNDGHALLDGDRLFLHYSDFEGLSVAGTKLTLANNYRAGQNFSVGTTFTTEGMLKYYMTGITATVTEIDDDGMVTCAVGPVFGIPYNSGTLSTLKNTYTQADSVELAFNKSFGSYTYIEFLGLSDFSIAAQVNAAFYPGGKYCVTQRQDNTSYNTMLLSASDYSSFEDYKTALTAKVGVSRWYSYFKIKFPLTKYSINGGKLDEGSASFVVSNNGAIASINDLIIDQMIDKDTGAMPVNSIPENSLLQIGSGYYVAVGSTPEDRVYMGYARTSAGAEPMSIASCDVAYANQFVRAGGQYVNISHFFERFALLLNDAPSEEKEILKRVVTDTMLGGDVAKFCHYDGKGVTTVLASGSNGSAFYVGVKLKLSDALLAYESTPIIYKDGEIEDSQRVYRICNHAVDVVGGAFDELPFYTEDVMSSKLKEISIDTKTTTFLHSGRLNTLGAAILGAERAEDIQNIGLLVKRLVQIVCLWLLFCSWAYTVICRSGMRVILDDVYHPGGNKQGVDLIRVFSLGTLSLDSEFTFGKCAVYTIIVLLVLTALSLL